MEHVHDFKINIQGRLAPDGSRRVFLRFEKAISTIAFSPDKAIAIAKDIIKTAKEVKKLKAKISVN